MSPNEKQASDEALDEQKRDSVYDFFYVDERRIGAMLSQFDDLGVPTRISISESLKKARGRAFKFSAGGGLAGLGNANLSIERGAAHESGNKQEQRDYDPFWVNALALLDYLESNDFLSRSVIGSRLGQIVLASGHLILTDLGILKDAWKDKTIRQAILSSQIQTKNANRHQRRSNQFGGVEQPSEIDMALALIPLMPHSLQARILGSNFMLWSSLDEQFVVGRASDTLLKHGAIVSGEWHTLALLDAFPYDPQAKTDEGRALSEFVAELAATPVGQMAVTMWPAAQALLGRPPAAFGVTPIIIFRKILSDNILETFTLPDE